MYGREGCVSLPGLLSRCLALVVRGQKLLLDQRCESPVAIPMALSASVARMSVSVSIRVRTPAVVKEDSVHLRGGRGLQTADILPQREVADDRRSN